MSEPLEALVISSSLTSRQLQVLNSYVRVVSGELKLREAARLASEGRLKGDSKNPLTVGSYSRTVNQARENIKRSVASLFIAVSLDLVRAEDVARLLDLAQRGTRRLSEMERQKLVDLVDALLEKIVR